MNAWPVLVSTCIARRSNARKAISSLLAQDQDTRGSPSSQSLHVGAQPGPGYLPHRVLFKCRQSDPLPFTRDHSRQRVSAYLALAVTLHSRSLYVALPHFVHRRPVGICSHPACMIT